LTSSRHTLLCYWWTASPGPRSVSQILRDARLPNQEHIPDPGLLFFSIAAHRRPSFLELLLPRPGARARARATLPISRRERKASRPAKSSVAPSPCPPHLHPDLDSFRPRLRSPATRSMVGGPLYLPIPSLYLISASVFRIPGPLGCENPVMA